MKFLRVVYFYLRVVAWLRSSTRAQVQIPARSATPFSLSFPLHPNFLPPIMSSPISSPSRAPFTNITNDAALLSSPIRGKRRGDDQVTASKRAKLELQPEIPPAQEIDPCQASSSTLSAPPLRRPGLYGLRHALRMGDAAARRILARTYPFFRSGIYLSKKIFF